MIHELKTWPRYFNDVLRGVKTFEYRVNDRNYQVGDTLHLREWDPDTKEYTGNEFRARVTYILTEERAAPFYIPNSCVIMAIVPVPKVFKVPAADPIILAAIRKHTSASQ